MPAEVLARVKLTTPAGAVSIYSMANQPPEALDQLKPGEVYLASGGNMTCAYWGELLTATARMKGALGAVINGYHRDTPRVLEQNWPVFSRGSYAQDSGVRAMVSDYRCPVVIDDLHINPGDLVVGDMDGVVIIPSSTEKEVIVRALEKLESEGLVRREIENGQSITSIFLKYKVL